MSTPAPTPASLSPSGPDPSVDALYRSYVSPLALRRLRGVPSAPGGPAAVPAPLPDVEELDGVVALLDVEGFSAFAERMGARGADGIERLATRVNDTFAAMVEAIERYGGVAHSFPGDSVIAVWTAADRPLDEALQSATRCCLELLEAHRDSELPLKAGLSCGRLRLAHVGGVDGRLHLLLGGSPLDEMGRAEERSSRGRLIVSEAAWGLLATHAVPAVQADGFVEVKALRSAAPPTTASAAAAAPTAGADTLRHYVPAALARQLDAGNAE